MKKLLAIILVMLMIVTVFAGCGGGGTSSSSGNETSSSSTPTEPSKWPSGYYFNETDFKGQNLHLWNLGTPEEGDAGKEFMEATGVTIKSTVTDYGERLAAVATAIISGANCDIVSIDNAQFPSYALRNLLVPITDVIDIFDSNVIDQNKLNKGVTDFFTMDGKCYGFNVSTQPVGCAYIIYRKSMMDEAGLDYPYDVWQEGNWDFDTFKDYCAALTYDSDNDGVLDKYAITGNISQHMLGTVGSNANIVRWDEEGRPQFALDDPDIIEAYQFLQDIRDLEYYKVITNANSDFKNGNMAMFFDIITWHSANILDVIPVEDIGWVPLPYSPSNKDKVTFNMTHSGCIAIPTSMKGKEALVKEYIDYAYCHQRADYDYEAETQKIIDNTYGGSREWYEFADLMDNTMLIENGSSFGNLGALIGDIFWGSGDTITNRTQAIAPACQMEIDNVFYGE